MDFVAGALLYVCFGGRFCNPAAIAVPRGICREGTFRVDGICAVLWRSNLSTVIAVPGGVCTAVSRSVGVIVFLWWSGVFAFW